MFNISCAYGYKFSTFVLHFNGHVNTRYKFILLDVKCVGSYDYGIYFAQYEAFRVKTAFLIKIPLPVTWNVNGGTQILRNRRFHMK